jgi:hypothetical protein
MEEGFVLDLGHHSSRAPATWIEGKPEKSFWTGLNIKDREQLPITSFRCKNCGLLLNYAI